VGVMLKEMLHEPSYVSGQFCSGDLAVAVGWVERRNARTGCLPVWNEARDVCLIVSGEILADEEECEALGIAGGSSRDRAASVMRLYERWGLHFVEKCNGWFSGVLVDLRERFAAVFNDRYGLGRLYWREDSAGFWFASEAKALLRVFPETRRLDARGLGEYVSCGCALENRTIFSGLSLFPGASVWRFFPGRPAVRESYFRKEVWEGQAELEPEEYQERLLSTFARVLPRYLRGGERVALSLTGGVESRMVMAWSGCKDDELPCYTFGGSYRESNDVRLGREVARICGQRHFVIPVGNQFLASFPEMAEKVICVSDGAMNVSGAVELYVNREARSIAPVRVTGNYGGEILRGLISLKPRLVSKRLFSPELVTESRVAAETCLRLHKAHPLSFIAFNQVPWHHYGRLSVEQSQLKVRSPFLDGDLVALAYQAPASGRSKGVSLKLIAEGNKALVNMRTDRGMLEQRHLVSAARRLYEAVTFRAEYVYDYGMPQWLSRLDRALGRWGMERIFLGRHKFYHFRVWYRDQLRGYVREMLLDPKTLSRPFFDRKGLERIVDRHTRGIGNHTSELHQALSLELVMRKLIES
jgi:asparagine synthase (glutamine-hydrolysing)